jgi:hypothetical protein
VYLYVPFAPDVHTTSATTSNQKRAMKIMPAPPYPHIRVATFSKNALVVVCNGTDIKAHPVSA